MIIRRLGSSLQLITQPDHAALAAWIVREWDGEHFPDSPRRASILRAVEQHDTGWDEGDEALILDEEGDLVDFAQLPDRLKRAASLRGIERLAHDPYAAALVAQHRLHVYRQFLEDPDWRAFFGAVKEARDAGLRAAGLGLDQLLADYPIVRAGDLASLAFCNEWQTAEDPEACRYTMRLEGTRLTLAPDPYGGRTVAIRIAAREIPRRRFSSQEEARRTVAAAPAITLEGSVTGAPA